MGSCDERTGLSCREVEFYAQFGVDGLSVAETLPDEPDARPRWRVAGRLCGNHR